MNMRKLLGAAGVACFMTICSGGVFGMIFDIVNAGKTDTSKKTVSIEAFKTDVKLGTNANTFRTDVVEKLDSSAASGMRIGIIEKICEDCLAIDVSGNDVETKNKREEFIANVMPFLNALKDDGGVEALVAAGGAYSSSNPYKMYSKVRAQNARDYSSTAGMYRKIEVDGHSVGEWVFHKFGRGSYDVFLMKKIAENIEVGGEGEVTTACGFIDELLTGQKKAAGSIELDGTEVSYGNARAIAGTLATAGKKGELFDAVIDEYLKATESSVSASAASALSEDDGLGLLLEGKGFVLSSGVSDDIKDDLLKGLRDAEGWGYGLSRMLLEKGVKASSLGSEPKTLKKAIESLS